MPILIYKGDTTNNFGKYLPTPYIERVSIGDEARCNVSLSVFVKVDENEKIDDVLSRINSQLNIYLLFVLNKEVPVHSGITSYDAGHAHRYSIDEANLRGETAHAASPDDVRIRHMHRIGNGTVVESQSNCYPNCITSFGSPGVGPHTHTLQYNPSIERVLNGELNIFEYYRSVYETNNNSTHSIVYLTSLALDLSEATVTEEFYDENGDRIIKFNANVAFQPLDVLDASTDNYEWTQANDFTILSFTSTFSYMENAEGLDAELENEAFFNKQTSDIAYEKIFENGELVSQLQVEFFDSGGTIYNGTPLQSVNGVYYKAENIEHATIVDYFNELLRQVAAKRHSKLQKWKNKVAYILGIYGDKTDLLYQLNLLRKAFPDKSSATPIGNFYFRFKKRIFATNKNIQTNAQLSRKVIRNPKFVDERSVPGATAAGTAWKESWNDNYYLYEGGYMGQTAMYSLPGSEQFSEYDAAIFASPGTEWEVQANTLTMAAWDESSQEFDAIVRNAGYFFFDYEKALRYVANINQLVDVEKLIKYGVPVDYNKFRISKARIKRSYGPVEEGGYTDPAKKQYAQIEADFDSSLSYPLTTTSLTEDTSEGLPTGLIINSPGFYSDYTPTGEASKLVLTQEEHTNLMIRNFEPVQTNEISSRIPNYRLICFEFQDFMDDDVATLSGWEALAEGPNKYETEVVITDESQKILTTFIRKYMESLADIESYIAAAELDFSFDESTGLFNEFFIDGMEAMYSANMAMAPWYRAPVLYNLHRDLVFDTFGGSMDAIFEDAQNIMSNINPFNGSYYSLIEFNENMRQFYEDTYDHTDSGNPIVLGNGVGTESEEKVFQSTLSFNSGGNTGEPYGVVHTPTADYTSVPPDEVVGAPFPLVPMTGDFPTYEERTGGSDDDISE